MGDLVDETYGRNLCVHQYENCVTETRWLQLEPMIAADEAYRRNLSNVWSIVRERAPAQPSFFERSERWRILLHSLISLATLLTSWRDSQVDRARDN